MIETMHPVNVLYREKFGFAIEVIEEPTSIKEATRKTTVRQIPANPR
jgi:hypothetical protein